MPTADDNRVSSADEEISHPGPFEPNGMPDLEEAQRFLTLLDPAASQFTFQYFAEKEVTHAREIFARQFSGRFSDVTSLLSAENAAGAGVYVTINETDLKGRKTENIVRSRAVWVDVDNDPAGEFRKALLACSLQPHVVVESSPGNTHAYWLVHDLNLDVHDAVLHTILERFNGDVNACGLARVMRLPGFRNHRHRGWARIINVNDAKPYSARQIFNEFPPLPRRDLLSSGSTTKPPDFGSHSRAITVGAETVDALRNALSWIPADDRELWIRVGCALSELGDVGRELWLHWSATSAKHSPDADYETWDSLRHDRTGFAAVFAEAKRRGWASPRLIHDVASQTHPTRSLVPIDAGALLDYEFPPREILLSPWLPTQSLSMIYAWRGVGKTHVALGIAYALATGGAFFGWHAKQPVKVLYLDGEMPGAALRERLAHLVRSCPAQLKEGFLTFLTPDLQENGFMPNLADRQGQEAIEAIVGDAQVLIVDNLSCLARAGNENEAEG